jgi:hypothetical protein
LFIVITETPIVEQPTDDSQTNNTPEISGLSIPVGNSQIQQNDRLIDENFQSGSTHVEQESSSSIELLIQAPEVTTVPKNSSFKSMTGKRSKGKNVLNIILRIEMLIIDVHLRLEKVRSMRRPIYVEAKPEVPNE